MRQMCGSGHASWDSVYGLLDILLWKREEDLELVVGAGRLLNPHNGWLRRHPCRDREQRAGFTITGIIHIPIHDSSYKFAHGMRNCIP